MPPISEIFQMALAADSILESAAMAIYRLLQNHAFEPEAIMTMAAAYDEVLHTRYALLIDLTR
jgi:hypothetical protein